MNCGTITIPKRRTGVMLADRTPKPAFAMVSAMFAETCVARHRSTLSRLLYRESC